MTKLESYMVDGQFTATQFLAEVDGHPADPGLARALEELRVLHPRRQGARRLPGRARTGPPLMDLAVVALTFGAIFVVELPDKTFIATLVLATKFRPRAGLDRRRARVHGADGGRRRARPRRVVPPPGRGPGAVALVMFLVGAVILFRQGRSHQVDSGEEYAEKAGVGGASGLKAVGASFVVLFAAEWGDLSQLLTLTLVARYEDPVSVFVGALGALLAVSGLAVLIGRALLGVVPLHTLHYVGAGVCVRARRPHRLRAARRLSVGRE